LFVAVTLLVTVTVTLHLMKYRRLERRAYGFQKQMHF